MSRPTRCGEFRAELRAFVRANHPDVGGDPEVFARGLAELRERARAGACDGSGSGRPGDERRADRYDAPVVLVRRRFWHRLFKRRVRRDLI